MVLWNKDVFMRSEASQVGKEEKYLQLCSVNPVAYLLLDFLCHSVLHRWLVGIITSPTERGWKLWKKTLIAFTGMFLVCCLWAVCAALVIHSYMLALPVASVRAFKIVFLKKLAHRGCGWLQIWVANIALVAIIKVLIWKLYFSKVGE